MTSNSAKKELTDGGAVSNINEEIHSSVLAFIKRLGYRQTEQVFRDEARNAGIETIAFELRAEQDSSLQPSVLLEKIVSVGSMKSSASENTEIDKSSSLMYENMFGKLKQWVFNSLDIYRDELTQVLYPMFIHCFLDLIAKNNSGTAHQFFEKYRDEFRHMHGDELARLCSINDNTQLKENSLASTYRNNKYNLTLSAYSFQLLINFLQENSFFTLLKILNQYVNIRVLVVRPSVPSTSAPSKTSLEKDQRPQGVVGLSQSLQNHVNLEAVSWGVLPIDTLNESEVLRRLKNDIAANGTLKTQDQLNNAINQIRKNLISSSEHAPKQAYLPRPPAGAAELSLLVEKLKGLANRAILSSSNLPSICCYTIHNSYDGICCAEFSPDFTLMAVGNRESFIDVWSLTKQRLRSFKPSTELSGMSTTDLELVDNVFENSGSFFKRLVGHSGPVYSCKFSPDNQFLFSSSQDGTVRMWSLCTFSNLVVFKGHNGPVWDIDVGPSGHYFVSGSADRTARLWSTQGLQPLRLFVGHLSDVDVVKFHPNSNYVFTGSSDKSIRMWDIHKGTCVRLFTGHARGITSIAVSSNGRLLASGDSAGIIKVWDIADGKLVRSLSFESNGATKASSIYSLSFCQDGKILSSCHADNSVKLWDIQKPPTGVNEEPVAFIHTKQTPLISSRFTARNVLSVAGAFSIE